MRHLPLVCLLLSCSDTGLTQRPDGNVTNDMDDPCGDDAPAPGGVEADPDCALEPATGTFDPVVQWEMPSFSEHSGSVNIMGTAVVGHLTDDDSDGVFGSDGDVPDIAVMTYSPGVLRIISGDGSKVHWSYAGQSLQGQGTPAIGDVDGDGDPEVVVVAESGKVVALHHDGRVAWTSAALSVNDSGSGVDVAWACSAPAIADMDGDGVPEVIAGRAILAGDSGELLGRGNLGAGTLPGNVGTTSFAVDLDLDGQLEVITGNATYTRDGRLKHYTHPETDGYVAVGDFDDDPEGEIVVVRNGTVTVHNHDFTTLWGPTSLGTALGGPPTVADFDGDGEPEIGVAGASLYVVVDTDGTVMWSRPTQDATSGVTGSSVYDFEGDGIAEVVYADEVTLWVFDGRDGRVKLQDDGHASNTWLEYPVVADVDGDGHAEIVLGHNPWQGGKPGAGISVYEDLNRSWYPTRQVWNQHAYHVVNVEDDGTIPADPTTNWASYNTFRSADLHAGLGDAAPDLVPQILGVCEDECADGMARIWVRAANQGAIDHPVDVRLVVEVDGRELGFARVGAVPVGRTSQARRIDVAAADVQGGFTVRVAAGAGQCRTDNDVVAWDGVCLP